MKKYTTFYQFCLLQNALTENCKEQIKKLKKPHKVCSVETPADLTGLTLDQLADLQTMKAEEAGTKAVEIILGIKDTRKILNEDCAVILGFLNFVKSEAEKIHKLFDQVKPTPTAEQQQAGIDKLNFGIFGLIDWYARRMGYSDHDKAKQTKWIIVWQCMKIDKENADFENRYREIIYKKAK